MPRVLGIDSSLTATGLCQVDWHGPNNWTIDTATVGAPKPTADKSKRAMVRRVNALMRQIESAITDGGSELKLTFGESITVPNLIAVEGLAYGAKGDSAWVLPWVFGRVIELAEKYDVPLLVVGTTARAKFVTGRGNADKDTVMLAAAKRWPEAEVANNNEADALAVAAVGCYYLGYPICEPTQAMADVLTKVSN